jgi:hypothetical protein
MNIYYHLISEFKTANNLAALLKVKPSTVYKWKTRKIPIKYIIDIEYYSKRVLTRNFLRPDKFNKETHK